MFSTLVKKIFGSRNERTLNRMEKLVCRINGMEPFMQALSDPELANKTPALKQRLEQGETLDDLLPEAFAVVREAAIRTLGMRHFDVQLIGGMVLHEGKIAEMRTGEGKTLAATLPAYLNALTGKGVHIVTVNDYLAKRDAQEMGPLYEFLGLSVGVIYPDMPHDVKQSAYRADILYGTNNEFGFDYLRDNMAFSLQDKVQHTLNFAIVDEVDSILIDEARTPLIISGAQEGAQELYTHINKIIPELREQKEEGDGGDYTIEAKQKQVHLTEEGHQHVESVLLREGLLEKGQSLYHAANIILMHHVNAALRAHVMFHRDVEYIVKNDQVIIVDEHTGRSMPGRRWSDGLHQAVEAKEQVSIQRENQTLASITFQNYFRHYNKLSGMTGTADTEAFEFQQIYNLEVVVMPTNKPMIRDDDPDLVYLSLQDKFDAVIEDVKQAVVKKQPVLVGTASIESSELLSHLMHKAGIKHQVLNAKFHEQEAHIIAEAGRPGVVTIATNMAGRGTDIVLGGNLKAQLAALPADVSDEEKNAIITDWNQRHQTVIQAGGLRIIGSERHESRRIDNQLRGRSGRQGDPGSSRFYLSLDDNLMRIFTSERVISMMRKLGMKPGEPIEHKLVTRAIENAQKKLEGYHFDVRKQLLDYDNVANNQRQVIYTQRAEIMAMSDPGSVIESMRSQVVEQLMETYIPLQSMEDLWDLSGLTKVLQEDFQLDVDIPAWAEQDHHLQPEQIKEKLLVLLADQYSAKGRDIDSQTRAQLEKSLILQILDAQWREHLAAMDYLRQGIHLRGYAQKDPRQEYKREAFDLFTTMLQSIKYDIIRTMSAMTIQPTSEAEWLDRNFQDHAMENMPQNLVYSHDAEPALTAPQDTLAVPHRRFEQKTGRNEPCPCGSSKKYKHCHGSL